MSRLEETLLEQIAEAGLPEPTREYVFAKPVRMWQVDFSWPSLALAVEVEGGQWQQGRHQRGVGFDDDAQKYNALCVMGWTLLRFPTSWIKDRRAIRWLTLVIKLKQGEHSEQLRHEWNALLARH